MSTYLEVHTEYEEELLAEAIATVAGEMSIPVEIYEKGQEAHLYGFKGDKRPETAQFIVRRQFVGRSSNDLGWARQADGSYKVVISSFDSKGTYSSATRITEGVDVEYKRRVVERQIQKSTRFRGCRVTTTRTASGAVQMQIVNVRV